MIRMLVSYFLLSSLLFLLTAVQAATVTQSYVNNTPADVDPNQTSPVNRSVTVPVVDFATGAMITDVNIAIFFDKRDRNNGQCRAYNGGSVFNNEISFTLTSPDSTSVNLVSSNSGYYSGSVHPGNITVTFDDEGAVFAGTTPIAGTFQPEGNLSDFDDNTNIAGTWTLVMADSAAQDPLCFFSYTLTIEATTDADIRVSKSDLSANYTPGGNTSYTIEINNAGPIDVTGIQVSDVIPAGIDTFSWTCSGSGGAVCANSAGVGTINELVDIPKDGVITFIVNATYSSVP